MGKVSAPKEMRRVSTAKEVVTILGGIDAVCRMTGQDHKSVYHWMGKAASFPARHHDWMTKALRRRGYRAPARLWNQTPEQKAA